MNKKRVALCLKGAVARKHQRARFEYKNDIYASNNEYINIEAVYNMINKHIIDCNNSEYSFDIFIHCWNTDLQEKLDKLYQPKLSMYENNNLYDDMINSKIVQSYDYGGISSSISMAKCIELKIQYEREHNFIYDIVIIYRPDILLWKNMSLKNYNLEYITVNDHPNCNGDFHFVMNSYNANLFKQLYDSIDLGNKHICHYWIKNFIVNIIKLPITTDDITPGKYQEVFKSLKQCSLDHNYISLSLLQEYEITINDIF